MTTQDGTTVASGRTSPYQTPTTGQGFMPIDLTGYTWSARSVLDDGVTSEASALQPLGKSGPTAGTSEVMY